MNKDQVVSMPASSETTSHPYPYTLPTPSPIKTAADITPETVHLVMPINKFDTSRVELLPAVTPEIWIPILPNLISGWTCDPHWPCSQAIYPILRTNRTIIQACIPIVEGIMEITGEGRDDEHQNALLWAFVGQIDIEFQAQMLPCLKRFLANITDQLEEDWEWRETVTDVIGDIEDAVSSPG